MRGPNSAELSWLAIGGIVVTYDVWAMLNRKETLSMAFTRALSHPIRRWPVVLGSTLLYTHLILPQKYHKYDPLRIAGRMMFSDE